MSRCAPTDMAASETTRPPSEVKGVTVQGNDLVLAPLVLLPPPTIRGRLVSIRVAGDRLHQIFGLANEGGTVAGEPLNLADSTVRNYMLTADARCTSASCI